MPDAMLPQLCRSIEPTLLLNPPLDSDIMTEEIFGPLLPIITVRVNVCCRVALAESGWMPLASR